VNLAYEVRSAAIRAVRTGFHVIGLRNYPLKVLQLKPGKRIPGESGIRSVRFQKGCKVLLKKTSNSHPFLPVAQSRNQWLQTQPTWIARLEGAKVFGPDVAVCTEDGHLLEGASLAWEKKIEYHPVFRSPQFRRIHHLEKPAALLAVTGGNTYYHWLLECLPRLAMLQSLLRKKPELLLLVNGFSRRFQKDTLAYMGIPSKRCVSLEDYPALACKELWVPSYPCDMGICTPKITAFLRQGLFRSCDQGWPKKIFLVRRRNGRRLLHQESICREVERLGFQSIDPEEFSVAKQASMFHAAEVILAPHGAALANIIFCRKGARVIEMFSGNYANLCYQHLAGVCGLRHFSVHSWDLRSRLLDLDSRRMKNNPSPITITPQDLFPVLSKAGILQRSFRSGNP
jgi:hypothetical protein